MATNRDKRSGMVYRAAQRNYRRRLREYEEECRLAEQPQPPAIDEAPFQEVPNVSETGLGQMEVNEELAPLSDSEEIGEVVESNTADCSEEEEEDEEEDEEEEDEHSEVSRQVRPFGDVAFEDGLRLWALQNSLTHHALNQLLAHFRQHIPQYSLPEDSKTFLNPPATHVTNAEITKITGGQMWYQGIKKCLEMYFRDVPPTEDGLVIDFFVNGQPLYDGSSKQFWVLLMKLYNVPDAPVMTVAIFCGHSNPLFVEEYLRPFIDEFNALLHSGIYFGNRLCWLCLRAMISDTAASAFILGAQGQYAPSPCTKCTIRAERCGDRVYYPYTAERILRTDEVFRGDGYPDHVITVTPLLQLESFDLIRDVVVAERMNVMDKGVMGKLLLLWTQGFPFAKCKLTAQQQQEVSAHLRKLRLPSEYKRKLRDLRNVQHWKAAEYKLFLQLVSFVVLKGRLNKAAYQHFMLFFVAVTFLSTSYHKSKWDLASQMLEQFVANYGTVYSTTLLDSNVHNLLHVHKDVKRYGDLSTLSAYPFEAKVQDLKKLVRSGRHRLLQAANRIHELQQIDVARSPSDASEGQASVHSSSPDTVTAILRPGLTLRKNFRDQWCMTNMGNVLMFEMATQAEGKLEVKGYMFTKQVPAFMEPCLSAEANIYIANMEDLCTELKIVSSADIRCKLAAVETANEWEYIFVPMPHTYLT